MRKAHRPRGPGDASPPVPTETHRLELVFLADQRHATAIDADLRKHGGRVRALESRYSDTARSTETSIDGARIEISLERDSVFAGAATAAVCEVRFRLVSGRPEPLVLLATEWALRHPLWLSTVADAPRGEQLLRGDAAGTATKAVPPAFSGASDGAGLMRAVLKTCLAQIADNASQIASARYDAEHVHQLRIGIRRLRTATGELHAWAPALDCSWNPPLTTAFRLLGEYRDADTVGSVIERQLESAGAPHPSTRIASSEPPDPVAVVRAAPFQTALLGVFASTIDSQDGDAGSPDAEAAKRLAADRLDALQRKLKKGARRFERLDEAGQHRVRKRLKRLRYLAELLLPLYAERRVEAFLERIRPGQDAVGTHVDLLSGRRAARKVAETEDARAWFNVGWLTAELQRSAKQTRKALVRAARAPAFW